MNSIVILIKFKQLSSDLHELEYTTKRTFGSGKNENLLKIKNLLIISYAPSAKLDIEVNSTT